ncbi:MAG TPA: hypothetical protein VHU41_15820 [Thermoanaerobaculia bacterium]|nr:hypothetical protein [Thermoanaerobaculia bacterium]
MRKLAAVLLLLSASAVYAQRPTRPRDIPRSGPLMFGVEQYTKDLQDLSIAVKRESFIVAQMVAATGELHEEFQKHNALEKAHDHIEAAMRRATENPPAPGPVVKAVSQANDIVNHWRDNASSADLNDITRQILQKTGDVQPVLFHELDEVRKNKLTLKDLLAKLNSADDQLDDALNDALTSTFDFFRAGGGRM